MALALAADPGGAGRRSRRRASAGARVPRVPRERGPARTPRRARTGRAASGRSSPSCACSTRARARTAKSASRGCARPRNLWRNEVGDARSAADALRARARRGPGRPVAALRARRTRWSKRGTPPARPRRSGWRSSSPRRTPGGGRLSSRRAREHSRDHRRRATARSRTSRRPSRSSPSLTPPRSRARLESACEAAAASGDAARRPRPPPASGARAPVRGGVRARARPPRGAREAGPEGPRKRSRRWRTSKSSLERWDAASATLRRLVGIEEGDAAVDTALRLADACERAGRPGDARGALERARSIAPQQTGLTVRLTARSSGSTS